MGCCFTLVYNHLLYRYFQSKFIPTDQQSHPTLSPFHTHTPPTHLPFCFLVLLGFRCHMIGIIPSRICSEETQLAGGLCVRAMHVSGTCSAASISHYSFSLKGKKKSNLYLISMGNCSLMLLQWLTQPLFSFFCHFYCGCIFILSTKILILMSWQLNTLFLWSCNFNKNRFWQDSCGQLPVPPSNFWSSFQKFETEWSLKTIKLRLFWFQD